VRWASGCGPPRPAGAVACPPAGYCTTTSSRPGRPARGARRVATPPAR
jgi:hypothetical protein